MKTIIPRKYVVQWNYPAEIRFFRAMDEIGDALKSEFPFWRRSQNRLQVFDEMGRHLAMALDHVHLSFIVSEDAESHFDKSDFELVMRMHDLFQKYLPFDELKRIGVRYFFSLDFGHDFKQIVDRLQKRFFVNSPEIAKILQGKIFDNMYSVRLDLNDDMKQNLVIGPTTREEWLTIAKIDMTTFNNKEDAFRKFSLSLPENSVMVDSDYYAESVKASDLKLVIEKSSQTVRSQVKQLVEYYKKG